MPSIRMQKAEETRSRWSDGMSYLENMDVMLGNIPRNEYENYTVLWEVQDYKKQAKNGQSRRHI